MPLDFHFENPPQKEKSRPTLICKVFSFYFFTSETPENEKNRPTMICEVFSLYFFTSKALAERNESAYIDLRGFSACIDLQGFLAIFLSAYTDLQSFLLIFFSHQKPPQNEQSRPTLICNVLSLYLFRIKNPRRMKRVGPQ